MRAVKRNHENVKIITALATFTGVELLPIEMLGCPISKLAIVLIVLQ